MNKPDDLAPLVQEFIHYLLARGDRPIDEACEEWIPRHLLGRGPIFPLAFQTHAICDLVALYELTSRAGVVAAAALIFEKGGGRVSREECAEVAKKMVMDAGERLRLADVDAGPMQ